MIQIYISVTVFYLLFVVGARLNFVDFKFIAGRKIIITQIILAHLLVVPVVVVGLGSIVPLEPWIATGMILIAASPIGAISNYYAILAGGNAALSVTLTGITNILSFMTAPLICALIGKLLEIEAINDVPFASMIGQTIPIVLVPIILGLTIRHFYPAWTVRQQQSMERLSFMAISLLIIIIVSSTYDLLTPAVVQWAVVMAILFTAVLSGLGSLIARFAAPSLNKSQWSAIMFGFPARNLGLAALLAINVFGIIEMATFGVIFFVVQAFLLVPLAIVLRRERILR